MEKNLDMSDNRVYDAVKEGVRDAMWQMITNATDAPCGDFFEFLKAGVAKGIEDAMPYGDDILEAIEKGVKGSLPTTDLPGMGYTVHEKTCDETKGNYDDNPLLALYDEVIQQCMIREVISEHILLSQVGNTPIYKGLCPFHHDVNPSMEVNTESQKFKCLSCGEYGDVVDFVIKTLLIAEELALSVLAEKAGIDIKDFLKE